MRADTLSDPLLSAETNTGRGGSAESGASESARTSASDVMTADSNLFRDVDVDGPDVLTSDLLGESRVVKKGSITGTGQDRLDI